MSDLPPIRSSSAVDAEPLDSHRRAPASAVAPHSARDDRDPDDDPHVAAPARGV
ncbi:hypothetical protein [Embleya scabrispora]|uniref:hypothetical protein n=1 Tax=Embleya scabrispora TaxID=159449 RepID=UPI0013750983|nr:hypothetical protein [Embleya scabrispora]